MKQPKISIIVPIYNVEKYLDECMLSLLNQTLEDIEIILVDDESPDNCPKMCDEYANKDKRVKVVHKKMVDSVWLVIQDLMLQLESMLHSLILMILSI